MTPRVEWAIFSQSARSDGAGGFDLLSVLMQVQPPAFPLVLTFTLTIGVTAEPRSTHVVNLTLTTPGDPPLVAPPRSLFVGPEGAGQLSVNLEGALIRHAGELCVEIGFDDAPSPVHVARLQVAGSEASPQSGGAVH